MPKETFDFIVKSKLTNHTKPIGNESVWNAIEANLTKPVAKGFWSNSIIATSIIGVLGFSTIMFFVLSPQKSAENNLTSNQAKLTKGIYKEQVSLKNETTSELEKNNKIEIESKKSSTPIASEQKNEKLANEKTSIESNEVIQTPKNAITIAGETKVTPPQKENATEKTYVAGEVVKLRFEFQNVSGFPTKSVESWIEFPEWVDASSVKTLAHTDGLEIKTTIKEKYNTVIWVSKGNFGADLSKMDSRGYIEYSFKIREAKSQKDIASIKPLLK